MAIRLESYKNGWRRSLTDIGLQDQKYKGLIDQAEDLFDLHHTVMTTLLLDTNPRSDKLLKQYLVGVVMPPSGTDKLVYKPNQSEEDKAPALMRAVLRLFCFANSIKLFFNPADLREITSGELVGLVEAALNNFTTRIRAEEFDNALTDLYKVKYRISRDDEATVQSVWEELNGIKPVETTATVLQGPWGEPPGRTTPLTPK